MFASEGVGGYLGEHEMYGNNTLCTLNHAHVCVCVCVCVCVYTVRHYIYMHAVITHNTRRRIKRHYNHTHTSLYIPVLVSRRLDAIIGIKQLALHSKQR